MKIYKTTFNLTNDVSDLDSARQYLTEDDMTVYLRQSFPDMANLITHIEWVLENECGGYVMLYTVESLSVEQLNMVSEWVRGQNSDGLGEGFEQQPFAEKESRRDWYGGYYDENNEWVEDVDYDDDCYTMASFDWKTNKYQFEEVMV